LLTRHCYEMLQRIDGIEVGPEPELSVLLFRYLPENGDADAFNKRLVDAIQEDGRIFLSSTHLDETTYLRLIVLCFRTHLEEAELMLAVIHETIEKCRKEEKGG